MVHVQNLILGARPGPIAHKGGDKNTALGAELYLKLTVLCDQTYRLPKAHWLSEWAEGFIPGLLYGWRAQELYKGRSGTNFQILVLLSFFLSFNSLYFSLLKCDHKNLNLMIK